MSKYLKSVLLLFLIFVSGCGESADLESQEFMRKIETAFSSGQQEIPIKEIFPKKFDELCVYMPDSSMPEDTVMAVKDLNNKKVVTGNYTYKAHFLVFSVISGSSYEIYSFPSPQIRIADKLHWVRYSDGYHKFFENHLSLCELQKWFFPNRLRQKI